MLCQAQLRRFINLPHVSVAFRHNWVFQHPSKEQFNHVDEPGERIFELPKPKLTEVEESTAEWMHVERLLPNPVIPDPPQHDVYPTPSGWIPPKASSASLPYVVRRTRFHSFPVYQEISCGGSRKMTLMRQVQGDIWACQADLRNHLEKKYKKKMYIQVDEVCNKIRVRGLYLEDVSEFLKEKGL